MRQSLEKKYGFLANITMEEEKVYQVIIQSGKKLEKLKKEDAFSFLEDILTPHNRSIDVAILATAELGLTELTLFLLEHCANINYAALAAKIHNHTSLV